DLALGLDELDALDCRRRLRVAEIRVERQALLADKESGVRADEAGQVADVDRVRDEERLLERAAQPLDPVVHARPARNSSASRYPSGPLPTMRWAARSEMTETRRQSSRSSTFERCTSTIGTSKSSSASRIA